ncbi:hypothetical protein MA16_Dca006027 [Dendrobium catenatum]|uniref:Uncharacterized protein n=1 Tax=Dendrobium catenatum TaxID=906689 RepID=A0A2I0WJZ2_9ASPA|nr:hypothetical protein MA16_Dca006027 [Dendrobium catenatum]
MIRRLRGIHDIIRIRKIIQPVSINQSSIQFTVDRVIFLLIKPGVKKTNRGKVKKTTIENGFVKIPQPAVRQRNPTNFFIFITATVKISHQNPGLSHIKRNINNTIPKRFSVLWRVCNVDYRNIEIRVKT